MYMYMHFYHTLSSFQKRNYCDSSSGEMVMYMHFYQGNPKTRKPESGAGNRIPESETGIRNQNPESRIHKSKKTSSSNLRKLFCIAFVGKKKALSAKRYLGMIGKSHYNKQNFVARLKWQSHHDDWCKQISQH